MGDFEHICCGIRMCLFLSTSFLKSAQRYLGSIPSRKIWRCSLMRTALHAADSLLDLSPDSLFQFGTRGVNVFRQCTALQIAWLSCLRVDCRSEHELPNANHPL